MDAVVKVKTGTRVFYGWWILIAGLLIQTYGSGSYQYGFGVYFKPISEEYGWTRAETAGAFSLDSMEGALGGPVIGPLIDKFGPRKMLVVGTVVLSGGMVLLSTINSLLTFYLVYVLIAIGFNTGFHWASQTAVANWFVRKRTIALGLLSAAQGLGGAIMAPTLAWLIEQQGWRTSLVLVGLSMFLFCMPLTFLIRHRPEKYGLLPDGDTPLVVEENASGIVSKATNNSEEKYFTLWEALRTRVWWQLALGFGLRGVGVGAVIVHQVPLLTDRGFDPQMAANSLGLLAFMSIPGRIIFGFLGDLFPKRYLLSLNYILQAVGLVLLMRATTMPEVFIFTLLYGLGWGSAPLMMSIRGEYFGRRYFATISGTNQALVMIGHLAGPILAGWIFDVTRSYQLAFTIFAATLVTGAVIHLFNTPPKPPKRYALESA